MKGWSLVQDAQKGMNSGRIDEAEAETILGQFINHTRVSRSKLVGSFVDMRARGLLKRLRKHSEVTFVRVRIDRLSDVVVEAWRDEIGDSPVACGVLTQEACACIHNVSTRIER